MKYFLLVFCYVISPAYLYAQNLVPNPSFEDTATLVGYGNCPFTLSVQGYDAVEIAKGWSSFRETPDYFNSCDSGQSFNEVGVPFNGAGYQKAATGKAYCGLYTVGYPYGSSYREFIGAQLLQNLIQGNKYYVSLKVSLADYSSSASNKLGISFSNNAYSYDKPAPINDQAKLYASSIITDTMNWTIISGSFIADSAYKYIIIGNFFSDQLTQFIAYPNGDTSAYYYIDDVCVSTDSLGCDMNITGINKVADKDIITYPNPAKDNLYVANAFGKTLTISFLNLLGQTVKVFENQSALKVSSIPNGVYIVRINYGDEVIKKKQIIIH